MSEHGVTFEWVEDYFGPCKATLADEMSFAMRSSYWTYRLAANLAMAALLGAAEERGRHKALYCDWCNREKSEPLCPIHDNDE